MPFMQADAFDAPSVPRLSGLAPGADGNWVDAEQSYMLPTSRYDWEPVCSDQQTHPPQEDDGWELMKEWLIMRPKDVDRNPLTNEVQTEAYSSQNFPPQPSYPIPPAAFTSTSHSFIGHPSGLTSASPLLSSASSSSRSTNSTPPLRTPPLGSQLVLPEYDPGYGNNFETAQVGSRQTYFNPTPYGLVSDGAYGVMHPVATGSFADFDLNGNYGPAPFQQLQISDSISTNEDVASQSSVHMGYQGTFPFLPQDQSTYKGSYFKSEEDRVTSDGASLAVSDAVFGEELTLGYTSHAQAASTGDITQNLPEATSLDQQPPLIHQQEDVRIASNEDGDCSQVFYYKRRLENGPLFPSPLLVHSDEPQTCKILLSSEEPCNHAFKPDGSDRLKHIQTHVDEQVGVVHHVSSGRRLSKKSNALLVCRWSDGMRSTCHRSVFTGVRSLKRHYDSHLPPRMKCPLCEKLFSESRMDSYNRHWKSRHADQIVSSQEGGEKELLSC
ncbi:hypothetical protein C8R42DRAFT_638772 [Lentinula raphanica]|nr:hypothetical protein C8R42DRAFT_638772 [Lentinula raphanica]